MTMANRAPAAESVQRYRRRADKRVDPEEFSACSLIWFYRRPSGHNLHSDRIGAVAAEIREMRGTEIVTKGQWA